MPPAPTLSPASRRLILAALTAGVLASMAYALGAGARVVIPVEATGCPFELLEGADMQVATQYDLDCRRRGTIQRFFVYWFLVCIGLVVLPLVGAYGRGLLDRLGPVPRAWFGERGRSFLARSALTLGAAGVSAAATGAELARAVCALYVAATIVGLFAEIAVTWGLATRVARPQPQPVALGSYRTASPRPARPDFDLVTCPRASSVAGALAACAVATAGYAMGLGSPSVVLAPPLLAWLVTAWDAR